MAKAPRRPDGSVDPMIIAAQQRALEVSEEIHRQLSNLKGGAPLLFALEKARDEAAEALQALAIANPFDPHEIMQLQNRVRLFDEFMRFLREIADDGNRVHLKMTEEERDILADAIAPESNRWMRGVAEPLGDDDDGPTQ